MISPSTGLSYLLTFTFSMSAITSNPDVSLPKTVCLLSSHGVGTYINVSKKIRLLTIKTILYNWKNICISTRYIDRLLTLYPEHECHVNGQHVCSSYFFIFLPSHHYSPTYLLLRYLFTILRTYRCNEELWPVGVGTRIGHGDRVGAIVSV